ncbi:MAG: hypothetical protein LUH05_08290 [Candidatus Gastranaerophilales bacterium]|nr:hypothetical protein [Candidatus Gastranaerophilales bacterium]
MFKVVYIAENSNDLFEEGIPEYITETEELPSLPQEALPSELGFIGNKLLISFGALAVCIAIILILAIIFKNKKQNSDASAHEIFADEEAEINNSEISDSKYSIEKKNRNVNTFSSIHKCITTFLEKTKDI